MAGSSGVQQQDKSGEVVEFKAGDIIFREGDPSGCLYVLRSGQVQVHIDANKKRIPLAIVNSGQFIGELSCVLAQGRTATATALTDVQAVRIKKEFLDSYLKSSPFWLSGLVKCLAERIQDTNEILRRNKTIDDQLRNKVSAAESKIKEDEP